LVYQILTNTTSVDRTPEQSSSTPEGRYLVSTLQPMTLIALAGTYNATCHANGIRSSPCRSPLRSSVVEPLARKRRVWVKENHTQLELAQILKAMVLEDYPEADKIVLVTDNLATNRLGTLYKAFEPELARTVAFKLEWHYTPDHASWLDMRPRPPGAS
jgi:hypothetical protein